MKSLTSIFILLFFSTICIAQNPIEEPLNSFSTLKVFDLVTVNLIKSDTNKIIISGRDAQDIEFVQKGDLLKVRMKVDKSFDGINTFVQVYYKEIDIIDGNEGAVIILNELVEQSQLTIQVQEGARVTGGLAVDNLNIRAVSGGIIELSGTANFQEVTVNTGGIVENEKLRSNHCTVRLQAGGEVDVYAVESADVQARAGGYIRVLGNPQKIKQRSIFGGKIIIE